MRSAVGACANVALILVARTRVRRRELAIRLAIGAGRARVVRQLLTESLVLAAAGGLAGVCLALLLAGSVRALVPATVISRLPGGYDALSLEWRTAVATVVAIVVSGLLAGLSSISACRFREGFDDLRSATPERVQGGRLPMQTVLVIGQTAVAIVLLIAGGMLLKSLDHLRRVDLGVEPREGLVVWLNLNLSRYPTNDDRVRFYGAVFEQLAAQPDVAHASGIDTPFHLEWQTTRIATVGATREAPERWPVALARATTPTYFERQGIRRLRGRTFTDQDDARSPPVAIVSQALAGSVAEVGDGERIAVAPIGEHELALVVGAPEVIRGSRARERRSLGPIASAAPPRDEPVAIQDRVDGTDGGTADPQHAAAQPLPDLGRAPTREVPLDPHDLPLEQRRELIRLPIRPSLSIGQRLQPTSLIAVPNLVAGFPRDPELGTEPGHLLAVAPRGRIQSTLKPAGFTLST
jgi:hypothetical protein